MNERIRELLNEAEKSVTFLSNSNESKHQIAMQRFAELIITECLLALEPDPMAPAINYDVEEKFYKRSAEKIKQHFGVEE
jgi:hypothetical protein